MPLRAKDIAEELGVSTATVSLVLNNKPGVSDTRRQEIIKKIKELGGEYLIKEQRGNNKGVIGFVVYKRASSIIDESPFFAYILEGINKSVGKHGYTLNFLYVNKNTPHEELEYKLNTSDYKGLIIFAVEMYSDDLEVYITETGMREVPKEILEIGLQFT